MNAPIAATGDPNGRPDPTVEVTRDVTRTVIQTRTVEVTPTPGQTGFGIGVAIVALLAAAMLALHRRD